MSAPEFSQTNVPTSWQETYVYVLRHRTTRAHSSTGDHSTDNGPYKTIVLFHGLASEQVDDIEEDTALNKLLTLTTLS